MAGPLSDSRRTRWLILVTVALVGPVGAQLVCFRGYHSSYQPVVVWLHWLMAAESVMLWILAWSLGLLGPSNRHLRIFADELRVTPLSAGEVLSQCLRSVARPGMVIWALLALSNWITAGAVLRSVPARPFWLDVKFALDDLRLLLLGPDSIVHPSGDTSLSWSYMFVPVLFGTLASQLILFTGVMLSRIKALRSCLEVASSPNSILILTLYWLGSLAAYAVWLTTADSIPFRFGSCVIDMDQIALASISPGLHACLMLGTLVCIRWLMKHANWREQ